MAVTIGLGPAAGASGSGQGGVPAGLEAFMAQAGAMSAEGAQDGSSSDLAANPFMAQLAAALQALQSGSAEDLQAAALAFSGQQGQILQKQVLQAVPQDSVGQELPLDPTFSSAVMATFAAVQEMIRQHGIAEADDSAAMLDQVVSDETALTDSVSDPSALSAALAATSSVQIQTTSSVAVTTTSDSENISSIASTSAVNPQAMIVQVESDLNKTNLTKAAQVQAAQVQATADDGAQQMNARVSASSALSSPTQIEQSAKNQPVNDPSVQIALARLQAELVPTKAVDGSDSAKPLHAAVGQKNIVATVTMNPANDASADQLAQRLALDSGVDLESSAHAIEQAAGNASMARHTENSALVQQGLDAGIGVDASLKTTNSRVEATNASQLQSAAALAEAKVEAARASLASGPLNVEVLRLTRQGGGRAVLEVTPPNQGPIRLDLQLDGSGRASLIVEGLSEALRTRLEGTAHFLRQDMAQMGLALNLEMRERSDAQAQQAAFGQGGFQSQREAERQSLENSLTSSTGPESATKAGILSPTEKDGGVYLYA